MATKPLESEPWNNEPLQWRGRPYDGAIVSEDGELYIPHDPNQYDAELTRRAERKTS